MMWTRFFRRGRRERELIRELESYLAHEVDDNLARGMSRAEAERAARLKLGNRTLVRESERERDSLRWLESLWRDLRYGVRQLRLSPGFTAAALLSLALGIGANAAVFQLLDAVRMRSLPVARPQDLMEVRFDDRTSRLGSHTSYTSNLTFPLFRELRERQQGFEDLFAWGTETFAIQDAAGTTPAAGLWVTGNVFSSLGVSAERGTLFGSTYDAQGCSPGVVLSDGYWHSRFGGRDDVVGATLKLFNTVFPVIGVTPASFSGLEVGKTFDIALPTCVIANGPQTSINRRDLFWIIGMGRVKPGWTPARAAAQIGSISAAVLTAAEPTGYDAKGLAEWHAARLSAFPAGQGISRLRDQYERALWLLLALAGLVLVIACANLANLLMARATARSREMALRLALGASRGRLVRQLLADSLLLAFVGTTIGVGVAQALSRTLVRFLSTAREPFDLHLTLDWRVWLFTSGLAALTCVLFGLAPAVRSSRGQAADAMKAGGRVTAGARDRFSFQRLLIVSQVSLSLVLLMGAFVFVTSFRNLTTLDPGFRRDGLIFADINLGSLQPERPRIRALQRDVLDRMRTVPGITGVAMTSHIALQGMNWMLGVRVPGYESSAPDWSQYTWVSPGYFRTMGIPMIRGRDFDDHDTDASRGVLVVNETFARKAFGTDDPIGKTVVSLAEPGYDEKTYAIVGLVGDTKYADLRDEIPPIAYVPELQNPRWGPRFRAVIRAAVPEGDAVSAVRAELTRMNPGIQVSFDVLRALVGDRLVRERTLAWLAGFFGLLAAMLTAIGLYGVISYVVERRRTEMGVRLALGSTRGQIVTLVLRQTLPLLAAGLIIGAAVALAAGRSAASLLFGLQPGDPRSLALAAAVLGAIALVACLVPARRASRIHPMRALREE
ncbi:MAG TPA: ABC transporter permease [Vicinamibacterales bacterium]|jgi:predicted permease|nr:ABC transporter permease [Vicinamibacterales bacterium]